MENYSIETRDGETCTLDLIFKDDTGTAIDLTDHTAYAQVREFPESPVLLESFTCQVTAETGKVSLSLSSEQTKRLFEYGLPETPFPGNTRERRRHDPVYFCWDLCLENADERTYYIGGPLVIYPVVTVPEPPL